MRMLLCLAGAMVLACAVPAWGAPPPVVSASVGVCDFNSPAHCAAPNSDGSINVRSTAGAGTNTPTAGTTSTIVTGGTAVTLIAASATLHGCYIYNPPTATDEGIATAENVYVNPVTTATVTGNGTNSSIAPSQSWTCPPGQTTAVSANAATSSHALTVVKW